LKQIVNTRQLGWLVVTVYLATGMMSIPQQLTRIARVDAWFTYIFAALFAFLIIYVLYRLARLFPGKHLFEITTLLAGKWGGGLINVLLLLHLWFIFVRDADYFTGFIKTILLPRTPIEMLYLLLFIVMIYYAGSSIEVSARVNELVLPFFVIVVLLLPILLSREISFNSLEPFLTHPPYQFGIAGGINAAFFGDILVIGAFMNTVKDPKQMLVALRQAVIFSAFLLTYVVITCIFVLGSSITGRQAFPIYTLVQQIAITDFLDRIDLLMVSIYFPVYLISLAVVFMAILTGLSWFAKAKDHTVYARPTGLLLMMTSFLAFRGMPEVNDFSKYGYPAFVLIEKPAILLVLFLLSLRKKIRKEEPNRPQPKSETEKKKNSRKSWTVREWKKSTNMLLLSGVVFIALGLRFAVRTQWIGLICAAGYAVCLILAVYTSFMETRRASSEV
jgi:spore germination protein KB